MYCNQQHCAHAPRITVVCIQIEDNIKLYPVKKTKKTNHDNILTIFTTSSTMTFNFIVHVSDPMPSGVQIWSLGPRRKPKLSQWWGVANKNCSTNHQANSSFNALLFTIFKKFNIFEFIQLFSFVCTSKYNQTGIISSFVVY